ncbi:MAG: VOC family protein [Aureliella sp.]
MAIQGVTPVLNVSNVGESILWFEALGWKRGFTWNGGGIIEGHELDDAHGPADFGSVCGESGTIFLCQDGQGQRANAVSDEGMWISWWIDSKKNVDAMHATAVRLGYEVTHPPTDEPWGVREFHLKHPDGHVFRVGCGIEEE